MERKMARMMLLLLVAAAFAALAIALGVATYIFASQTFAILLGFLSLICFLGSGISAGICLLVLLFGPQVKGPYEAPSRPRYEG
jgi:hypothetical protein